MPAQGGVWKTCVAGNPGENSSVTLKTVTGNVIITSVARIDIIMSRSILVCAAMLLVLGGAWPVEAYANADAVETGRLLAILLDSGRVTIGNNQELINDPDRGDKAFTPDVFEKQMSAQFKDRTGIDLGDLPNAKIPEMAKPLLARLAGESKKTVDSYQTVINLQGMRYKGLIPATFGTETAARFQRWSGVYLKQTAPDQLLRNPRNKADEFEAAVMKKYAEMSASQDSNLVTNEVVDGGKTLRVMVLLFYKKACLACHGEPKGERDITGYPREGGKEGEIGGAISVKMPLP